MTDDEMKFRITEIREFERMDIVEFFRYYAIFEAKLEQRLNRLKNG